MSSKKSFIDFFDDFGSRTLCGWTKVVGSKYNIQLLFFKSYTVIYDLSVFKLCVILQLVYGR